MATAAPEIPALARDRAFENLYRRYVDDVYRYALALLRNPADAEDVTQTTFLNAYRAVKRGEEIEKPQNWLIKIAHNAARTRYARAARRVDEVPLEDHLEQLAVPEVERPQVHEVLDALGRLPLNQRAALVMRELEGRTYAEIADTLGVSVSAVETLIFRARRSLRVKASAVRVLGVVPAPGWLWNLLDGGGVAGGGAAAAGGAALGGGAAAGGGTIVGSGFLLKAAVAVVAGVVASGISSDRGRQAHAAGSPLADAASMSASGGMALSAGVAGEDAQPGGSAASGASGSTAVGSFIPRAELGSAPRNPLADVPRTTPAQAVLVGAGPTGGVQGSPAAPASTRSTGLGAPAGSPTQVVTTVVGGAANTVPLPAVPSLPAAVPVPKSPVQVPSPPVQVPSAPVHVPSPPPVHVPSPPVQVPQPPVKVSPPPVQLPPPPVPVPLP
jgi:RNA polymerase sigma factor (sigma-70 family)